MLNFTIKVPFFNDVFDSNITERKVDTAYHWRANFCVANTIVASFCISYQNLQNVALTNSLLG